MQLLKPKKLKYKKNQRKNYPFDSFRLEKLSFGRYGLIAKTGGILTSKQIETIRQVLTRHFSKKGKIWIKIFPKDGITQKSNTSRMGKGKGDVKYWVSRIRKGKIFMEFDCVFVLDVKKLSKILNCRISFFLKIIRLV